MNIKQSIAIGLLATITCAASYFAFQKYSHSSISHEQRMANAFQKIDDTIESLENKKNSSNNIINQQDEQDVVIQSCGATGLPCSQSDYCCSGCCWAGTCEDADMCCQAYGQTCTGQSGNTHGDCCTEYICAACYLPNNGSNDIQAAPAGTGGLCQTNTSWTVIDCGSGGLGAPCYNSLACQSDFVCSANMCQCNPDGCAGVSCPCTENSECCQGNCYLGYCQTPEANCAECYNDGQCASGNCVSTDGVTSYCYIEGCKYGMETCSTCFAGSDCWACNNNSNCSSGNCVNGSCYITDCVYGATACASCSSGELGDTCATDVNCQSQYTCQDGFCSCTSPAGLNCPCSSNSECVSTTVCDGTVCTLCFADGTGCSNDGQCCNNTCINGLCSYAPANGGECADNSQCSSGVCNNINENETGLCSDCLSISSLCCNDAQCCSGLQCISGACNCSQDEAGGNGCSCTNASECASNNCAAGLCTGCYSIGEFCDGDNQCCSTQCIENMCSCAPNTGCVCNSNSQCGTGCCDAGGLCSEKAGIGQTCYNDGQCASNICDIPEGISTGTCACSPYPTENTCMCQQQQDCLSDFCNAGICEAPYSDYMPCTTDNECASHQCIELSCSCAPNDGCQCTSNSQCNSGVCDAGLCESCQVTAMTCTNNGQCCSGICNMPDGMTGTCGCSTGQVTTEKICTLPSGRTFQCGSTTTGAAQESCPCAQNIDCMSGNCVAGLCQDCFAAGLACSQNYECCNNDCSDYICGGIDEWVNWIVMAVTTIIITILVVFSGGAAAGLYAWAFGEEAALEAVTVGMETAIDASELGTIDFIASLAPNLTDAEFLAAMGMAESSFDIVVAGALGAIDTTAAFVGEVVLVVSSYLTVLPALDFGLSEMIYNWSYKIFSFAVEEDAANLAAGETITVGSDTVSETGSVEEGDADLTITNSTGGTTTYSQAQVKAAEETAENEIKTGQIDATQAQEEWNASTEKVTLDVDKAAAKDTWDTTYQPEVKADEETLRNNAEQDVADETTTINGDTTDKTIKTKSGATIKATDTPGTEKGLEVNLYDGQTEDLSVTKANDVTTVNLETKDGDTAIVSKGDSSVDLSASNSTTGDSKDLSATVTQNGDVKDLTVTRNGTTEEFSNTKVLQAQADKTTLDTEITAEKQVVKAEEQAAKAAKESKIKTEEDAVEEAKSQAYQQAKIIEAEDLEKAQTALQEFQKAVEDFKANIAQKIKDIDIENMTPKEIKQAITKDIDKCYQKATEIYQDIMTKAQTKYDELEGTIDEERYELISKINEQLPYNPVDLETEIQKVEDELGPITRTKKDGSTVTYENGTKTEKTTYPDGGTKTVTTDGKGTKTKEITNADGSSYTKLVEKSNGTKTITTEIQNEDGSITRTTIDNDGTRTEETTYSDGYKSIEITKSDGTKTEEITWPDGQIDKKTTFTDGSWESETTRTDEHGTTEITKTDSDGNTTITRIKTNSDGTRTIETIDQDGNETIEITDKDGKVIDLTGNNLGKAKSWWQTAKEAWNSSWTGKDNDILNSIKQKLTTDPDKGAYGPGGYDENWYNNEYPDEWEDDLSDLESDRSSTYSLRSDGSSQWSHEDFSEDFSNKIDDVQENLEVEGIEPKDVVADDVSDLKTNIAAKQASAQAKKATFDNEFSNFNKDDIPPKYDWNTFPKSKAQNKKAQNKKVTFDETKNTTTIFTRDNDTLNTTTIFTRDNDTLNTTTIFTRDNDTFWQTAKESLSYMKTSFDNTWDDIVDSLSSMRSSVEDQWIKFTQSLEKVYDNLTVKMTDQQVRDAFKAAQSADRMNDDDIRALLAQASQETGLNLNKFDQWMKGDFSTKIEKVIFQQK